MACLVSFACGAAPTGDTRAYPVESRCVALAEVNDERAVFEFPVDDRDVWSWNRNATPASALEYSWSAELRDGQSVYEVGFFYFMQPSALPTAGPLSSLLRWGQASAFQRAGSNYRLFSSEVRVRADADACAVIVEVRTPEILELLTAARPRTVRLRAETPDGGWAREVEVAYFRSAAPR